MVVFIVPDGCLKGKYPLTNLRAEERIDVDLDAGMEEDAMRPRYQPTMSRHETKPGKQTTCFF